MPSFRTCNKHSVARCPPPWTREYKQAFLNESLGEVGGFHYNTSAVVRESYDLAAGKRGACRAVLCSFIDWFLLFLVARCLLACLVSLSCLVCRESSISWIISLSL